MQPGWVRWIAYILLASLVVVTSCQAMAGTGRAPEAVEAANPAAVGPSSGDGHGGGALMAQRFGGKYSPGSQPRGKIGAIPSRRRAFRRRGSAGARRAPSMCARC